MVRGAQTVQQFRLLLQRQTRNFALVVAPIAPFDLYISSQRIHNVPQCQFGSGSLEKDVLP